METLLNQFNRFFGDSFDIVIRGALEYLSELLFAIHRAIRFSPVEELIEQDAQRPNVRLKRLWLFLKTFWRHVSDAPGLQALVPTSFIGRRGPAEIAQLDVESFI